MCGRRTGKNGARFAPIDLQRSTGACLARDPAKKVGHGLGAGFVGGAIGVTGTDVGGGLDHGVSFLIVNFLSDSNMALENRPYKRDFLPFHLSAT